MRMVLTHVRDVVVDGGRWRIDRALSGDADRSHAACLSPRLCHRGPQRGPHTRRSTAMTLPANFALSPGMGVWAGFCGISQACWPTFL